jgi:hypothetical protein
MRFFDTWKKNSSVRKFIFPVLYGVFYYLHLKHKKAEIDLDTIFVIKRIIIKLVLWIKIGENTTDKHDINIDFITKFLRGNTALLKFFFLGAQFDIK